MNHKARRANHSVDRQLVSHRISAPNSLTQSCLQTEQSDSDQDDVKIVVPEISSNSFIKQSNIAGRNAVDGSANQNKIFAPHGRKVVNGSANKNLPNPFLKSELNTMPGKYTPSSLAFSTNVHQRSNSKDRHLSQATMNVNDQHGHGARTHA